MNLYTAQVKWAGYRVDSITVDTEMDVWPTPEYPHGQKALHMNNTWERMREYRIPGILWLDPDVAADPDDLAAMQQAVEMAPACMHTGLVKLWPESTQLDHWIWSHRLGTLGQPIATQLVTDVVAYVSTGFLWTPAELLDLVFPLIRDAQWAEVDVALSEHALQAGIIARTVTGCQPKHLHFRKEHDGNHIAEQAQRRANDGKR